MNEDIDIYWNEIRNQDQQVCQGDELKFGKIDHKRV